MPDLTALSEPVLPAFGRGCLTELIPALLEPGSVSADFLPGNVIEARAVVVVLFDGMGWLQLRERERLAPTLSDMSGGPITTVAPSTTVTALTSLSTGVPPGTHGMIGYRMAFPEGLLNALRWTTPSGDARNRIVPESIQTVPAFRDQRCPVVMNSKFAESGFSRAHLRGTRMSGFEQLSSLVVEVRRLVAANESFVYAYHDGLDRVGHEFGLGEHYDAELHCCDRMVGDLLTVLPRDTAVVVTADHGLVDCSKGATSIDPRVRSLARGESGEARFRWLHARPGSERDLLAAAREIHSNHAWIHPVDEIVEQGWFGPELRAEARARLGDVALVAKGNHALLHPSDPTPATLKGRHGSLTAAEMLVPALHLLL